MSDKMRPIKFPNLITWIKEEYQKQGTIFGIHKEKFYQVKPGNKVELFGEVMSTPIGPAAGPHTQLAQNIVSAYLTGARFIELKTVQVIDGEDLPVSKPCILAQDEGYNVEWSTELTTKEAFQEYVKAWFLLHVLMKELNISKTKDFVFNMSVGYDLKGIKEKKIDDFIEGLKDAEKTDIWKECFNYLENNINLFTNFTLDDLHNISPNIARSITLSTLHGCPPEEIEKIVEYLLIEKKLFTFIKLNPTLLGYDFVSTTLKEMGYSYIFLNQHHFKNDLQYDDGIKILKRLRKLAQEENLEVGVKLTNTLPVKILKGELPGEEMYMSGRSLYPLTISLARMLADEFNGDLKISYSGGVDYFNIDKILSTGIQPITFATTLLKPGGYERITQMAKKIEDSVETFNKIDLEKLTELSKSAKFDKYHLKAYKINKPKLNSQLPLMNCQVASCTNACPINQEIPEYLKLASEKNFNKAFEVIVKDNSSPFITGTICPHKCEYNCTRLDYESSLSIREMKKLIAENAEEKYIENLKPQELRSDKKVVIIGAGPAGLSSAFFLRRNGLDVTVLEKNEKPYGMVQYLIPKFRINQEAIDLDFELVKRSGVKFVFGVDENFSIEELKEEYDYIVLSIGTWVPQTLDIKTDNKNVYDAISFLKQFNDNNYNINLGKNVCVIGGGDVAVDTSRAAKRCNGVNNVSIIYRRTKDLMPASKEEIDYLLNEGIEVKELLTPVSFLNNKLRCEIMELGEMDNTGRRRPQPTNKFIDIDCDTLIVAVGEKVDTKILRDNGIKVDEKGYAIIDKNNQTSCENVYVAGDMKEGPKTIVEAIADGKVVTQAILSKENLTSDFIKSKINIVDKSLYDRKGIISERKDNIEETKRCLGCNYVCEICVDVCPNRANVPINIEGRIQILHIDYMCNECGNCGVFCPHTGNPYKDKITLFSNEADFLDSSNVGFFLLDKEKGLFKVRTENKEIIEYLLDEENKLSKELASMIKTCISDYDYLIKGD